MSFLPLTNTVASSPGSNCFSLARNSCRMLLSITLLVSLSHTKFICCSSIMSVISRYLSMCPSTCSYLIAAVVLFLVFLMFLRISAQLAPDRTLLFLFWYVDCTHAVTPYLCGAILYLVKGGQGSNQMMNGPHTQLFCSIGVYTVWFFPIGCLWGLFFAPLSLLGQYCNTSTLRYWWWVLCLYLW